MKKKSPYRPKYQQGGKREVTDPINYLISYYNSEKFKERAAKAPGKTNPSLSNPSYFSEMASWTSPYMLPEGYSDGKDFIGSGPYVNKNFFPEKYRGLHIPEGTSILLDPDELKSTGTKVNTKDMASNYLIHDVLPHEVSHQSERLLSWDEEKEFAMRNRLQKNQAKSLFDRNKVEKYHKDAYGSTGDAMNLFSNYIKEGKHGDQHDMAPDENYADINALRYMLFKEGIYDARKKNFTSEDLKKAKENKFIKGSYDMKRLLKTFKDEDLIWLMNNIAKSSSKDASNMAQMGGSAKSILGYSRNSPYRNSPFLDIFTPEGLIDMSNTDMDLVGIDNLGNKKKMKARSKNPYKFEGSVVREIPAGRNPYMQQGGMQQLFQYLFEEDNDEQENTAPSTREVENATSQQEEMDRLAQEQEEYDLAMQIATEEFGSNPYRVDKTSANLKQTADLYQGKILSSGQFGDKNIGEYGRSIYGSLTKDLGYAPTVNSIYRSREQQDALIKSGAPAAKNSWHLTGNAIDLKPTDWNKLPLSKQQFYRDNYDVIYHNNHYHIEPK